MWLKHNSIYSRCHWWNFKFLTLDLDSPGKIHPNITSNNPIRWGHIFLQCGCRTNVTIAGVIDWIFNFHGQIQNLLEIPVRMMYNTTWLSKIYIITKEWPRVISKHVPGLSKKTPWHCQIVTSVILWNGFQSIWHGFREKSEYFMGIFLFCSSQSQPEISHSEY